ncbi:hypothetical protein GCM10010149_62630 [Nonomuraea roseoviolacea subsp. roseoviolacea]|uniref:CBS domain-containing protein n=1 Tax=Nonomuraea roseoviolacea TaxID=103837 RepID=UPI0031DDD899
MLVREVMSSPVVTVGRTTSIRQAVRVLYEHDITAAPVLDDAGRLVGVVSELDLLRGEFPPDPRASARPVPGGEGPPPALVWQVMTHAVVTVSETADVTAAVDLMVGKHVKSLPVLAGHRVVGMVSRRDLMRMLARPDEELRAEVAAALREHYPHGPFWEVAVHDGVAELRPAPESRPSAGAGPSGALLASGPGDVLAEHVADVLARTVPGVVRVRHLG